MKRAAVLLAGTIAAGMILCAGPAPADTPPTHPLPPISADGKDWTAPNGPGQ